ncbi:MAG TPA: hypothetical protein VK348_04060, partial [Planctomycetota bacterium]|nr:hypothetical protein [Planctomycetota bacterium]
MTLLALAAAWLWIVPPVVEAQLRSQLRQFGFDGIHIAAIEVGFGHVTVRDLRLGGVEAGAGTLTIEAAAAEFTLADLLHQRMDTLVLDRPTWTMAAVPGRAWSPFRDGLRPGGGAEAAPMSSWPQLPVRRLAIHGGRIAAPEGPAAMSVTFDATLTATQQQGGAAVVLQFLGARPIELDGQCSWGPEPGGDLLALELRRRPGAFEVALSGTTWSGDGDLALAARVPFADLDAAALSLRVADFRLESTNGFEVQGLASEVHLQGLPMPRSIGAQQARWQGVQFAAIKAGSGSAEFELHSGFELQVGARQRAVDEIGAIAVSGLRLAPGSTSYPANVVFDQVPLQQWLELLSGGRVTGAGRLSGSLTLVVQMDPSLGIDLQAGSLAAVAGGSVRFLDDAATEGMIRQQVQQIAASTGHDALVQERLVAALKDFVFSVLDFRLEPDAASDAVTLRVHAVGEGRQVPQPLDLEVNLRGFDQAVDTAIAIKLGMDSARRRIHPRV